MDIKKELNTAVVNEVIAENKVHILEKRIQRLESFVNRFLDPEDLGYAINKCLRDDAREALGRSRVESPSKEKKP